MSSSKKKVSQGKDVATPAFKIRKGISIVWIIPIVTALIGGWLIFNTLSEQGPKITVSFKTAEGIEAGKTKVKFKDIEIGVVDTVDFSDDFSKIVLTAKMAKETEPFLKRDTRFWVVKPQLSLRGVSGLSTLVSGSHIEIEPGKGAPRLNFIGLEEAPVVKSEVSGTKITLMSKELGSIGAGSPVYYHGIEAGEVLGYELASDRSSVFVHAFIKSPFNEIVRSNSRFWNVSGVEATLDSEGITVRTESIETILFGGIAFETPKTLESASNDMTGLVFTLYDDYKDIEKSGYIKRILFIAYFNGSVRGLDIGAPVELKGIKVGSVVDVRLEYDSLETSFLIPVLIEIEPERIIEKGVKGTVAPHQTLKKLIDKGLRAQMKTGSLLTGKLFIDLDMHPETPIHLVDSSGLYPELPTIPGGFEQIMSSVTSILTKLEKVEIDRIGERILSLLDGADKLINSDEVQGSADDLRASLAAFRSILQKIDPHTEAIAENLDDALKSGRITLDKSQTTLDLLNEVLKSDSPVQYKLNQLSDELSEMARSVRIFVDMLERNPNAVIFGKGSPGD